MTLSYRTILILSLGAGAGGALWWILARGPAEQEDGHRRIPVARVPVRPPATGAGAAAKAEDREALLAVVQDETHRLAFTYGMDLARVAREPEAALLSVLEADRAAAPGAPGSLTERTDIYSVPPPWTQVLTLMDRLPSTTDFAAVDTMLLTLDGTSPDGASRVPDAAGVHGARAVGLATWGAKQPFETAAYLEGCPAVSPRNWRG